MDAEFTFTKKHRDAIADARGEHGVPAGRVELRFTPRQLRGKTIVRLTPKQATQYQLARENNVPLVLQLTKKQVGGFLMVSRARQSGGALAPVDDRNVVTRPSAAGKHATGTAADVVTTLTRDIPSVSGFSAPPVKVTGHPAFY